MAQKSQDTTNWPDMFVGLYDRLTGNNAEITYKFDSMEIDVPASTSENAARAHWKLNGTLRISARNRAEAQ